MTAARTSKTSTRASKAKPHAGVTSSRGQSSTRSTTANKPSSLRRGSQSQSRDFQSRDRDENSRGYSTSDRNQFRDSSQSQDQRNNGSSMNGYGPHESQRYSGSQGQGSSQSFQGRTQDDWRQGQGRTQDDWRQGQGYGNQGSSQGRRNQMQNQYGESENRSFNGRGGSKYRENWDGDIEERREPAGMSGAPYDDEMDDQDRGGYSVSSSWDTDMDDEDELHDNSQHFAAGGEGQDWDSDEEEETPPTRSLGRRSSQSRSTSNY